MGKLSGKVAVITGGNSGIGLSSAQLFKAEGATVVINARNEKRLAETREQLGDAFDIVQLDVSKVSEIDQVFQQIGGKHGKIDVLFLNAGVAPFIPLEAYDENTYDHLFNVNVKGVFFSVQKALPYLSEGASVIITTSVVNQMGMPASSAYAATKAAVRSLAQSLSAELLPRGIRVNALSPGPIETPIFGKMGMNDEQIQEMAGGILQQVPMGRFGSSDEVAKAALFFASDDSSYVVGAELEVDGGMATL
ncbi:MAG: SDR family oxidoreductase [Bacteroidota bacterium]